MMTPGRDVNQRRAKIIATIGPATKSIESLRALIEAGMDVARLNFSHGEFSEHAEMIENIRQASKEAGRSIAILQDLQGPKLRTGKMRGKKPIMLEEGSGLVLTPKPISGTSNRISVNYPALSDDVVAGDRILLDDGSIELKVTHVEAPDIETEILVGGRLGSHKGINLPGVKLSAPAITTKDIQDLTFGLEHRVDLIAMSYVRLPQDLLRLRKSIAEIKPGCESLPLIAKLERPEAIDHLDGILEVCEGVMVARGDLGVEVSAERVPSLQKQIIHRASSKLKIVITATQMLETMIHNPRPTRAEASDVANAVFDGSDVLMLSGETAVGEFPIRTVQTMDRIILDAEEHAHKWGYQLPEVEASKLDDAVATTHAAQSLAQDRNVAAIAVFTRSGRTAQLMSKARPKVPILAFTPENSTFNLMAIHWGVVPFLVPMAHNVEQMIDRVRDACLASGIVQTGEQVVVVASLPVGAMGPPNFSLLHTIA